MNSRDGQRARALRRIDDIITAWIFEGTSEIQQLVIARAISGLRIE